MNEMQFPCSQCGNGIVVDDSAAGTEVVCPQCNDSTIVATSRLDSRRLMTGLATTALSKDGASSNGKTPGILKRGEGFARFTAAVLGIAVGIGLSLLCYWMSPRTSLLSRMFDFRDLQVVVPISILVVFFWGLFLCYHRWRRVRAVEQISSPKLLSGAVLTLEHTGLEALAVHLDEADAEFNPLLRRLKALVAQWSLKSGLVEADLILQQFVTDDKEAARRGYSLVRTFVWALPVLGLIGTVLGIAFAVGGFASFLGGGVDDVDAIKKSLVGITSGLSFAFLLTLLGLATSLVLMLIASGLETREERVHQNIQQRVARTFLPVLQRVCPTEEMGKPRLAPVVGPLKTAAESVLAHVAHLAEGHFTKLSESLEKQQQQVSAWGHSLQDQASSAAAVVKGSLQEAAQNVRESGNEFLARLQLIREAWRQQTNLLNARLDEQTRANELLATRLLDAGQIQAETVAAFDATLKTTQEVLRGCAVAVASLDGGIRRIAESPLEPVANALAKSLEEVNKESAKIAHTLTSLTESTRCTAELQGNILNGVEQLHDLQLVATLTSFRDSLTRHANLVDKLNGGLKITLS